MRQCAEPSVARRCRDAAGSASLAAVASLGSACAISAVLLSADLVWTDLLHTNPGRTAWETLATALVFPILGAIMGVLWFALPIAAGSALLCVLALAWGRPARFDCAAIVAFGLAVFACLWMATPPGIDEASGTTLDGPNWSMLAGGGSVLAVSLWVGWWFQRRRAATRAARRRH